MKFASLYNAKPGDILVDNDGDWWIRTEAGAVALISGRDGAGPSVVKWDADDMKPSSSLSMFGPFKKAGAL